MVHGRPSSFHKLHVLYGLRRRRLAKLDVTFSPPCGPSGWLLFLSFLLPLPSVHDDVQQSLRVLEEQHNCISDEYLGQILQPAPMRQAFDSECVHKR